MERQQKVSQQLNPLVRFVLILQIHCPGKLEEKLVH